VSGSRLCRKRGGSHALGGARARRKESRSPAPVCMSIRNKLALRPDGHVPIVRKPAELGVVVALADEVGLSVPVEPVEHRTLLSSANVVGEQDGLVLHAPHEGNIPAVRRRLGRRPHRQIRRSALACHPSGRRAARWRSFL